uniref:RanBP2-type domain-containing protein n=1 Tax=Ditylenchus dipsaci TaxID=166011 RepID=A0A915ECN2_9BILA
MNAAAAIANWSCQRCTLLNNIQSDKCKACDYANPITGKRESSFKSKFKIPTLSFATAIEKLDSALDLVSTQLYSPRSSGSNVGIPIAYSLETSSWQCPPVCK